VVRSSAASDVYKRQRSCFALLKNQMHPRIGDLGWEIGDWGLGI
jgi:hypothetical protein